jgi:hypothetical protein
MIYNIDTISHYCYFAFAEGGIGLEDYALQLYPSAVMNNFVYSFGDMYDAVRDSIILLFTPAQGETQIPFKAGLGVGYALYLAMRPPANPKPRPVYPNPAKTTTPPPM